MLKIKIMKYKVKKVILFFLILKLIYMIYAIIEINPVLYRCIHKYR